MPDQLTSADLNRLYAEKRFLEIEQARKEGRLADILRAPRPIDTDRQLSKAEVQTLYGQRRYSEIEAARQRGQLNDLLGIDRPETNE